MIGHFGRSKQAPKQPCPHQHASLSCLAYEVENGQWGGMPSESNVLLSYLMPSSVPTEPHGPFSTLSESFSHH